MSYTTDLNIYPYSDGVCKFESSDLGMGRFEYSRNGRPEKSRIFAVMEPDSIKVFENTGHKDGERAMKSILSLTRLYKSAAMAVNKRNKAQLGTLAISFDRLSFIDSDYRKSLFRWGTGGGTTEAKVERLEIGQDLEVIKTIQSYRSVDGNFDKTNYSLPTGSDIVQNVIRSGGFEALLLSMLAASTSNTDKIIFTNPEAFIKAPDDIRKLQE